MTPPHAPTKARTRPPSQVLLVAALCVSAAASLAQTAATTRQRPLSSHSVPTVQKDNLTFRDLDRDGRLSPFEDWRLSPATRAADLLRRLSLEEKAGLMMHGSAPAVGDAALGRGTAYDLKAAAIMMDGAHVTTFITRLAAPPSDFARQNNALQELAEQTRFAIPVTISTDPRNAFTDVLGASVSAGAFTRWPGPLGLAAIGDPAVTRRFADDARREYLAVGIHEALSPQADLATEPRWPRIDGTFGENANAVRRQVQAYIEGFQQGDDGLHPGSVACVVKHWLGYGAAKDGWDSHNIYGSHAIFPGNNLAQHEIPFQGAFAAHVAAVMPTYSILQDARFDGKPIEPVGAGMNRTLLTGWLRGRDHFRGILLSDWLITENCLDQCIDGAPAGQPPAILPGHYGMSWGTESLTVSGRYAKAIDAGIDQFGGVSDSSLIVDLVRSGKVSEARIGESALRILEAKFAQGLFDHPFVDETAAPHIVGSQAFQQDSLDAQHRSMVLLRNELLPRTQHHALPLGPRGLRVALYGFTEQTARAHGLIVVSPADHPDAILVRLNAPHQLLHPGYFFGSRQHEGDLDFKAGDPQWQAWQTLAATGAPLLVSIYLDRPAILTQLLPAAHAIVADFGVSEDAILDVLTGVAQPQGHLPFELPSSMEAVRAQKSDLPHDSVHPLYPYGFGLSYAARP